MKILLALLCLSLCGATPPAEAREVTGEDAVDPLKHKFEIASRDRAWTLRVGLTAQIWLLVEDEMPAGGEREPEATVEFRRVRPTLSGTAFTSRFSYLFHLSVLPDEWEFMDLMGDYAFTPRFHLRFGQWKIPFTRYRTRSYKDRQLVDWAIVSPYFGAERQIGVALHSGYTAKAPEPFEWSLGVFSGVNARSSHGVGPSKLFEASTDVERRAIHPEVVARIGYNHNGIDTTGEGDLLGGPFRFAVHASAAWDLQPVFAEDWALRAAVEGLIKVRGFSVAATGYLATVQDGDDPGSQHLGATGAWISAGYVIAHRVEIAGQYAVVLPDGGSPLQEPRAGVNVFILGRRVQWRTDVGAVLGCDTGDRTADVQVRSLIQASL